MIKKTTFILALVISQLSLAKQPYTIYSSNGKKVPYEKMIKVLTKKEIILFGEAHNNPIAHWLEIKIAKELNKSNNLIIGAEMFETDNQTQLNEYLSDNINKEAFDSTTRLWSNYETDYAPLVDYAKEQKIQFIATNIPRRYAHQVYLNGFSTLDSLPENEKKWICPLPIEFDPNLPTYKNILQMMGDHGTPDLVQAQAIKDATMAYFIITNYKKGSSFLHLNGSYHSDFHEGIIWYLNKINTQLNHVTISVVSQNEISFLKEENIGRADFIICVDEDMTTSY